jgi:hypothetical protein
VSALEAVPVWTTELVQDHEFAGNRRLQVFSDMRALALRGYL